MGSTLHCEEVWEEPRGWGIWRKGILRVLVDVCCDAIMTSTLVWGVGGWFDLHIQAPVHYQVQSSGTQSETEVDGEGTLLTALLPQAHAQFPQATKAHLPRVATTTVGRDLLHKLSVKKSTPWSTPIGLSDGDNVLVDLQTTWISQPRPVSQLLSLDGKGHVPQPFEV